MTEQLAYTLKSGIMVEHCRGKGVAEHVWRPFFHRRDLGEVVLYHFPHLHVGYALSFAVEEKSVGDSRYILVASALIVLKDFGQFVAEGNDTLFVAFSSHLQLLVDETHVVVVESGEFGEPDACLVEYYYNSTREAVAVCVLPHPWVEQPVHFLFPHEIGQWLVGFRPSDEMRRVLADEMMAEGVAEQRAQGTQPSVHRPCGVSPVHHVLHPVADDIGVNGFPRQLRVKFSEELFESTKVGIIVFYGIRRVVTLEFQVVQKFLNHRLNVLIGFRERIYGIKFKLPNFCGVFFTPQRRGASERRRRVPS